MSSPLRNYKVAYWRLWWRFCSNTTWGTSCDSLACNYGPVSDWEESSATKPSWKRMWGLTSLCRHTYAHVFGCFLSTDKKKQMWNLWKTKAMYFFKYLSVTLSVVLPAKIDNPVPASPVRFQQFRVIRGAARIFLRGGAEVMEAKALKKKNCLWLE